jgi:uncharacterized delta-60 repeat protein
VVWLARSVNLEEEVALKILPDFLVRDPNTVERLKTETIRNARLAHPNIARTFEFVHDHALTAIAMEYVEGWSLAAIRVDKPQKRYLLAEITPWIRQLCSALEYAHNEGRSVHGNLKTSNLMLDQRGELKVIDFGIDRSLRAMAGQADMNRVAVTLGFMSPQQALGEDPSLLDDVYGLGATIYDLLTGTPPFYKGQVLAQVCELKPQTMSERLAELGFEDSVSLVVEDAIAMCLEKEPAKRPPNIRAVLQLLERSEVPVSVVPQGRGAEEMHEVVEEILSPAGQEQKPGQAAEGDQDAGGVAGAPWEGAEVAQPLEVHRAAAVPREAEAALAAPAQPSSETVSPVKADAPPKRGRLFQVGMVGCLAVAAIAFWLLAGHGSIGSKRKAGNVDMRFNPATNADHEIRVALVQPDKKILIGGLFTQFGDGPHRSLARLNPDGSVDGSFIGTTGGEVHALALQPDGQIVIAGDFGKVNDSTRRRIARLAPDGTLDETFRATAGANRDIRSVFVQTDGKILIAGSFDLSSGKKLNRIGRFNPDGTRDNTFDPGSGAPAIIWSLAMQSDGKIIAGGDFATFDHQPCSRIARLNPDGKVDETFKAGGGANGQVFAVAVQKDGKILMGGDFIRVDQVERNHVARLNADGSLDQTFDPGPGPNSGVRCLAVQADGMILIGGIFTSVQGMPRSRIARLKADGTLDGMFDPGEGASEVVRWVGTQADGAVLIAGAFTKCDGVERMRIARLNGGTK